MYSDYVLDVPLKSQEEKGYVAVDKNSLKSLYFFYVTSPEDDSREAQNETA